MQRNGGQQVACAHIDCAHHEAQEHERQEALDAEMRHSKANAAGKHSSLDRKVPADGGKQEATEDDLKGGRGLRGSAFVAFIYGQEMHRGCRSGRGIEGAHLLPDGRADGDDDQVQTVGDLRQSKGLFAAGVPCTAPVPS